MDDDRQRYEDINTQKARDEVDHKVKQMTAYFSEQDTMLEMTAAYHNMVSRKTADRNSRRKNGRDRRWHKTACRKPSREQKAVDR